ncbi:hypothetical protein F5141DRAFT_274221 [Pisolithus sp. B1]|nr:hypothetical protein F5141DRAFT_274221 [Pisolithus sp. B1]
MVFRSQRSYPFCSLICCRVRSASEIASSAILGHRQLVFPTFRNVENIESSWFHPAVISRKSPSRPRFHTTFCISGITWRAISTGNELWFCHVESKGCKKSTEAFGVGGRAMRTPQPLGTCHTCLWSLELSQVRCTHRYPSEEGVSHMRTNRWNDIGQLLISSHHIIMAVPLPSGFNRVVRLLMLTRTPVDFRSPLVFLN